MNEADLESAIFRWARETEKRSLSCDIAIYNITKHFNQTESKLIRKMLEEGGTVSVGIMEDAAGLLSCMKTEEKVGTDEFEIMARLLSNMNEAEELHRYLIYGTELKWSKEELNDYVDYLGKKQYGGALNKKWFITGKNDNIGKGIKHYELKKALSKINCGANDLVLLSAGRNSSESLKNIASTMKYVSNDVRSE